MRLTACQLRLTGHGYPGSKVSLTSCKTNLAERDMRKMTEKEGNLWLIVAMTFMIAAVAALT